MAKLSLSAIILTNNEEKNLGKCLESISGIAGEIIVVDSYSTDKTLEIAKHFGAKIFQHPFVNQAEQFNWALDNANPKEEWVIKLDADEYITPELASEISETIPKADAGTSGFYMKRRVYFMGRWIRHGGYYPTWFLRLWRNGSARIEIREVDEHAMLLKGVAGKFKNDFVDDNKNGLRAWIAKQNEYSTREVSARMRGADDKNIKARLGGEQAERKRWMKQNFYGSFPRFFRAFLYFVYRYFFRFGFLDGKEGLVFHFLQGFWHQFVIDAKMYEAERQNSYEKK